MVYARCRQILREDAAAEDATQETFLRAMRHIQDNGEPESVTGWLYTVATNYCLNDIRNGRSRALLLDPSDSPLAGDQDALARRDLATRLIARADPSVRATAWLCHVDGMTQSEAAQVLGVSRRTVVDRLARLTRDARRFLERNDA